MCRGKGKFGVWGHHIYRVLQRLGKEKWFFYNCGVLKFVRRALRPLHVSLRPTPVNLGEFVHRTGHPDPIEILHFLHLGIQSARMNRSMKADERNAIYEAVHNVNCPP